nr:hypothetical protein [Cytophagales bacterium]
MKRRRFLKNAAISYGAIPFVSNPLAGITNNSKVHLFRYHHVVQITSPNIPIHPDNRLPFGWHAFCVLPEMNEPSVSLSFNSTDVSSYRNLWFRSCTVMDVRQEVLIEAYVGNTNQLIGIFDIRYPIIIQPFELAIPRKLHKKVLIEGISLKMVKGSTPVWFLNGNCGSDAKNYLLRAHLFSSVETKPSLENFLKNFYSINSVQQFGWMEGCVLDGLYDMFQKTGSVHIRNVINEHLSLFFDENNKLKYEGARSQILYDEIYGVECPLPISVIAKLYPDHPVIDLLIAYCLQNKNEIGLVHDGIVSTEGCYTLAYPLAISAVVKNTKEIANLAVQQLLLRHELLVKEGHIYQRGNLDGEVSFENWARGVAWYMLGLIRTWLVLQDHPEFKLLPGMDIIKNHYISSVLWSLNYQQKNGLWHCFLARPETGIDVSGSLGIAAAIAIGQKHGALPKDVSKQLDMTRRSLINYLTPDGFLTGCAQANKGGEELQEGGYRVIALFASGLYAQFLAAT